MTKRDFLKESRCIWNVGVPANTEGSVDRQKNKPMITRQAGYRDVAQKEYWEKETAVFWPCSKERWSWKVPYNRNSGSQAKKR